MLTYQTTCEIDCDYGSSVPNENNPHHAAASLEMIAKMLRENPDMRVTATITFMCDGMINHHTLIKDEKLTTKTSLLITESESVATRDDPRDNFSFSELYGALSKNAPKFVPLSRANSLAVTLGDRMIAIIKGAITTNKYRG